MNILYIAYSCSPKSGSEEKIGWSIPLESAKSNNVFVITKEEQFGDFVSILPVKGDAKGITLEGFKYPLADANVKSFSSLGISNEIQADCGKIWVNEGTLLVIEARD